MFEAQISYESFEPHENSKQANVVLNLYRRNSVDDPSIQHFDWEDFTHGPIPTHGILARRMGQIVAGAIISVDHNQPSAIWPSAYLNLLAVNPVFKQSHNRPGLGLGKNLLSQAHQLARSNGFDSMALHSTLGAVNFYQKQDYKIEFYVGGIPLMRKDLLSREPTTQPIQIV